MRNVEQNGGAEGHMRSGVLVSPSLGANDEVFQAAVAAGVFWAWCLLPGTNGRTICNNNLLVWTKSGAAA